MTATYYITALRALIQIFQRLKTTEERHAFMDRELDASLYADNLDMAVRRVKARCVDLACDPLEAAEALVRLESEMIARDERHPLHA